jgi:hypothetical protein
MAVRIKIPKPSTFMVLAIVAIVAFWFAKPSSPALRLKGKAAYEINYVNIDSRFSPPLVLDARMEVRPHTDFSFLARLTDVYLSGQDVEPINNATIDGVITINFTPVGTIDYIDFPVGMSEELRTIFTKFMYLSSVATPPKSGEHWEYEDTTYNLVSVGRLQKTKSGLVLPECESVEIVSYQFLARVSEAFWLDRNKGEEIFICKKADGTQYLSETTINMRKRRYNKNVEF